MSEETESGGEIKTPVGSVSFRGKRTAEFIAILSLCLLFLLGYVLWEHKADARDTGVSLRDAIKAMAEAQREGTVAQREMNCLISLPQDKREAEFYSPNSLCKRMAR